MTAVLPRWVYLPAAVGVTFIALPLAAMAARVDWSRFGALIWTPASRAALLLSLRTASASTMLCLLLGVPLALVLARHDGRPVRILRPLIVLPLVMPPVVGGLALLYTFGRLGLLVGLHRPESRATGDRTFERRGERRNSYQLGTGDYRG